MYSVFYTYGMANSDRWRMYNVQSKSNSLLTTTNPAQDCDGHLISQDV